MTVIMLIVVGAAAGFLATRMMKIEADIITTVAVGIVGALLGGILLQVAAGVLGLLGGFIGAVLGAMLVIWLWGQIRKK